MFGVDLETQPEIVQTVAGYAIQGWDLAAEWLLSPAAWSQFGLLIVAYVTALLVSRRLNLALEKLLDPSDSGIDFSLEFWVKGIDDGEHKYKSQLLFLIWNALKASGIEIPYPHRVVEIKGDMKGLIK
jgi:small-conductance mechanosensitive channel